MILLPNYLYNKKKEICQNEIIPNTKGFGIKFSSRKLKEANEIKLFNSSFSNFPFFSYCPCISILNHRNNKFYLLNLKKNLINKKLIHLSIWPISIRLKNFFFSKKFFAKTNFIKILFKTLKLNFQCFIKNLAIKAKNLIIFEIRQNQKLQAYIRKLNSFKRKGSKNKKISWFIKKESYKIKYGKNWKKILKEINSLKKQKLSNLNLKATYNQKHKKHKKKSSILKKNSLLQFKLKSKTYSNLGRSPVDKSFNGTINQSSNNNILIKNRLKNFVCFASNPDSNLNSESSNDLPSNPDSNLNSENSNILFSYFDSNSKKTPFQIWQIFLNNFWLKNEENFKCSIWKQTGKMQTFKDIELSLEEAIDHIEKSPNNSLGINLTNLDPPIICIDIDNEFVGEKIINIFEGKSNLTKKVIKSVFGTPFLIKTQSENHLHLYYKCPPQISKFEKYKKKLPTRLGFWAEYIYSNVTFASQDWTPLLIPFFENISELPVTLYPYSYTRSDELFELVTESFDKKDPTKKIIKPLSLGERNDEIFKYCRVDEFDINHVWAINFICCNGRLLESEIQKIQTNIQTFWKNKKRSSLLNIFELEPKNVKNNKPAPDFKDTGNTRKNEAIRRRTDNLVIEFVQFIEEEKEIFFPDWDWMGKSIEYVITSYLLQFENIKIKYSRSDFSFGVWNHSYWAPYKDTTMQEFMFSEVAKIGYGSFDMRFAGKITALSPLRSLCVIESWPKKNTLKGYAFQNGFLKYENEKPVLSPHNLDLLYRYVINSNYNSEDKLDLEMAALISDFTNGKLFDMHKLWLLFWLVINAGYGNASFFIYGPSGGAKSTLVKCLKSLYTNDQTSSIDDQALKNTTSIKAILAKNKIVTTFNDVTPALFGDITKEFVKLSLGRDDVTTDQKYKDGSNYESESIIIIVTNFHVWEFKAFSDPGFQQWFIKFTMPAITNHMTISEIEKIFERNKQAIINWAMNIPKELVQKAVRSGPINLITEYELEEIDRFFLTEVVFEKGNRLTSRELNEFYIQYKKKIGTYIAPPKNRTEDYSKLFFQFIFKTFNLKIENYQRIENSRDSQLRGYANINIIAASGKLKDTQEKFQYKIDKKLEDIFYTNPFKNYGHCVYNNEVDLKQYPLREEDKISEINNTLLAIAIANEGLGVSHVKWGEKVPLPKKPFDHLYNGMVDDSHLPWLKDTNWYKNYPILLLWDEKANCLISDELISSWLAILIKYCLGLNDEINKHKKQLLLPPPADYSISTASNSFSESNSSPASSSSFDYTKKELDAKEESELLDELDAGEESELLDELDAGEESELLDELDAGEESELLDAEESNKNKQESNFEPLDQEAEINVEWESDDEQEKNISKFLKRKNFNYKNIIKKLKKISTNLKNDYDLFFACLNLITESKNFDSFLILNIFQERLDRFWLDAKKIKNECQNFDFIRPYSSYKVKYLDVEIFSFLTEQLKYFSCWTSYPLINILNSFFGEIILNAWSVNAVAIKRDKNNYYKKLLSGTTSSSLEKNKISLQEEIINLNNSQKLNNELNFWESIKLVQEGWSLFPYCYSSGWESYGRLIGIPSTGVSNLKSNAKHAILNFLKEKTSLNWVELDIKSCHTVIAYSFMENIPNLPSIENHWNLLIKSFKDETKNLLNNFSQENNEEKSCLEHINSWNEKQCKSFIKIQWYKALNGGSCYSPSDNLEKAKNLLEIKSENFLIYNKLIEKIFKKLNLFQVLSQLQEDIGKTDKIYLPISDTPFETNTLSNKQKAEKKQFNKRITGISRIFTTCEVSLISMLYLILGEIEYDILPISYEADGLLLVGKFDQKDLPKMIKEINDRFQKISKLFIKNKISFEFKFSTC